MRKELNIGFSANKTNDLVGKLFILLCHIVSSFSIYCKGVIIIYLYKGCALPFITCEVKPARGSRTVRYEA